VNPPLTARRALAWAASAAVAVFVLSAATYGLFLTKPLGPGETPSPAIVAILSPAPSGSNQPLKSAASLVVKIKSTSPLTYTGGSAIGRTTLRGRHDHNCGCDPI
jgi:hypothetical protein